MPLPRCAVGVCYGDDAEGNRAKSAHWEPGCVVTPCPTQKRRRTPDPRSWLSGQPPWERVFEIPHHLRVVGDLVVMTRRKNPTATERSEGGSIEHLFPSTTSSWKMVRMARPPEATSTAPRTGLRWRRLPRIDWRKPCHLTVTYRGGAEAWVEVHARGDLGRYPGTTAIIDVLADITRNR